MNNEVDMVALLKALDEQEITLIDDSKRLPLAEQQDFKITRINGVYSKTPTHQPRKVDPKPSRNAPCPCGSGKKYKKCCL